MKTVWVVVECIGCGLCRMSDRLGRMMGRLIERVHQLGNQGCLGRRGLPGLYMAPSLGSHKTLGRSEMGGKAYPRKHVQLMLESVAQA